MEANSSGGMPGGTNFRELGVFPHSGLWGGFTMALTDTEIRRSKPAEKPYKLSDGGGLHLLVTPSGGRLWRWKYRFEGCREADGTWPLPRLTLADARERRDAARKQLVNGIDPMAERRAEKTAVIVATDHTFEKIAELVAGTLAGQQERPPRRDNTKPAEGERLPGPGRQAHCGSRADGACPACQRN